MSSLVCLLTVTAFIEVPTGLALLVMPAFVVKLLLGAEISGAGVPLGRVAGTALLALGVAGWLARSDAPGPAARGFVVAMSFYNIGVAVILAIAGLSSPPDGLALWPAVILHAAMAVWCLRFLICSKPVVPH